MSGQQLGPFGQSIHYSVELKSCDTGLRRVCYGVYDSRDKAESAMRFRASTERHPIGYVPFEDYLEIEAVRL